MDLDKTIRLLNDAYVVGDGGRQRELVAAAIKELAAQLSASDMAAGTMPHHIQQYLTELVILDR